MNKETKDETQAKESRNAIKVYDFDGLIVEVLETFDQEDSDSESGGGDDDSTVALDDLETDEQFLEEHSQVKTPTPQTYEQQPSASEITVLKTDQEEMEFPAYAANDLDGAAGMWAANLKLPCFRSEIQPMWQMPLLNRNIYQQASGPTDISFNETPRSIRPIKPPSSNPYEWKLRDVPAHTSESTLKPDSSLLSALKEMSEDKLINNLEDVCCSICNKIILTGLGITLKDCLHSFCHPCLTTAMEQNETVVMKCPSKTVFCDGDVRDEEIRSLLTSEAYERFVEQSLRKMDIYDLDELAWNFEFVENKKPFKCGICQEMITAGDGIVLKACLCTFCKVCLSQYIENKESPIVSCPFVAEDGTNCIGIIEDREVRALVPANVYGAMLKISLAQAEARCQNAFHCKTPDCPYWLELDGEWQEFECPKCGRVNCVMCEAVHQGATCQQYQNMINANTRNSHDNAMTADQVRTLINSRRAMHCPACGIVVEKVDGCNHMTCSACRHEFYWRGN